MDELNGHQFWGISPYLDLLAAAAAAEPGTADSTAPASFLQICPYDCRHTVATISSQVSKLHPGTAACTTPHTKTTDVATAGTGAADAATAEAPTSGTAASVAARADSTKPAAAAATSGFSSSTSNSSSSTSPPRQRQHSSQPQQQLQLYIYETAPEVLARHMLLLSVLFDQSLTVRERAEVFLELHGNILLRQKTADYLVTASKRLEDTVAQLSLCSTPAAAAVAGAAGPLQQQQAGLGVLQVFDLSLLKYQDRDALLETFQKYRQKSSFNVSKAWDDRCRKWYADRYDVRNNMIDWDYHMRLAPRGTPFLDSALGSIIHFHHFRHWRLTGVAYELRGSSYLAANTSMLSTAYGRTKEFKDRQLHDVGRSVSAFSYWGDVLNSPYHCFGTVADDPALFKVANKQFMHTAVDVAEHNILDFLKQLRSQRHPQAAAAAATAADGSTAGSSSSTVQEAHIANAARGPTSMENLTGTSAHDDKITEGKSLASAVNGGSADAAAPVADIQHQLQALAVDKQQQLGKPQQQQQQSADGFAKLRTLEAAITQASITQVTATTKIFLICGDLKRCLTGKSKYAGRFAAATVGHRHVHMLSPEYDLAQVLQPKGLVLVESGQNMVQLNNEQVRAFEDRVVEMAEAGGFRRHGVLGVAANSRSSSSGGVVAEQQQQTVQAWCVPPGHFALEVASEDL